MTNKEQAYDLRNKLSDIEHEITVTQSYMEHVQPDSEHWWKLLNTCLVEISSLCTEAKIQCQGMVEETQSLPPSGVPLSQMKRDTKEQPPAIVKVGIKGA